MPETTLDGRTRRRERNAERLYDAALEFSATRSFGEFTVEEICDHAGVGRATFFRIFENKAGLLREFNRRLAHDAAARIDNAGDTDLYRALHHVRDAIIDAWSDAGPGLAGMAREFTNTSRSADLHSPHPELFALVRQLIAAAIATGDLPGTVPADLAASLAVINLTAPVAYTLAGHPADTATLSQTLLDQWYIGMTAAPLRRG